MLEISSTGDLHPQTIRTPSTAKILRKACDVRLPLMWDDEDFSNLVDVICESINAVLRTTEIRDLSELIKKSTIQTCTVNIEVTKLWI